MVQDEIRVGVTRPKRRLSRAHSAESSAPPSPAPPSQPLSAWETFQAQQQRRLPPSAHAKAQVQNPAAHASPSRASSRRPDSSEKRASSSLTVEPLPYTPLPIQKAQGPMLLGIELKWISLATLSLQNAFLTIIMHYSRISVAPSRAYSGAAAVLLNELLKCTISSLIALKRVDQALWDQTRLSDGHKPRGNTLFHPTRLAALRRNILSPDCYKLAVPAILYVIQNNLQYIAASNLDVATFQVTYQMKILTTAFFSVLMLGKRLTRARWGALVLLAVGVAIVQLQAVRNTLPADGRVGAAMNPLKGFMAVTLACVTSGIAGVYFELLVKSGDNTDLWTRNTQLSLFSIVPALVPVLFAGPPPGMSWARGVVSRFDNFNGWAIGTVLTQTFGGLVTAIVIRYSDNIMKGFATSLSIVLSFLASVALFNYTLTFAFVVGASLVLAATWMYNSPTPERTTVAVAPGSPIPATAPILGESPAPSRANSLINLVTGARRASGSSGGASSSIPTILMPPSREGSASPFLASAVNSQVNLADLRQ